MALKRSNWQLEVAKGLTPTFAALMDAFIVFANRVHRCRSIAAASSEIPTLTFRIPQPPSPSGSSIATSPSYGNCTTPPSPYRISKANSSSLDNFESLLCVNGNSWAWGFMIDPSATPLDLLVTL
ncbi:uncharacterized protein JN550_004928 [Neoarthrinium moseri]|uniref:uncharacterized protein n=1 Tax=Neoarthrinium moseri TaxID=1658444 RepID=UPI001FDCE9C3|nr:uncharacterized protein JN550_004928 [Neoarthrinium moseri]KAI1870782.1 hypothetical protein JN550_004928 [Neoarthrinium moseri]